MHNVHIFCCILSALSVIGFSYGSASPDNLGNVLYGSELINTYLAEEFLC